MAPVKATKAAATKKGGATKKTAAAKKGGVSKKTAATKPAKAGRQGPKATQAEKELAFLLKCFRSVEPEDGPNYAELMRLTGLPYGAARSKFCRLQQKIVDRGL